MNIDYEQIPQVLTVPEVAHLLRIGRNAAYTLVTAGNIRCVHIGRSIRIPRTALVQFLENAQPNN